MPDQKYYGLIVAAGLGTRFGGAKQFAPLAGKPLVAWSLDAFERCRRVAGYVLVVRKADVGRATRLATRLGLRRLLAVVAGGRHRADSVRSGLTALPKQGIVAVHDAARPLLTPAMLSSGFLACRRLGPATYGTPVIDTLKRTVSGRISSTVSRENLYAVQTPQFSPLPMLRRALARAAAGGANVTDDCAALELLGAKPVVILSRTPNIKVTTRSDLALARFLL